MEPQPISSSTVDTSRPFSSVKEAVAIFGERLLVGEIYSPKPFSSDSNSSSNTTASAAAAATATAYSNSPIIKREPSWRFSSPTPPSTPITKSSSKEENHNNNDDDNALYDTVRKLEAELEKTKAELKLLKERGSETEVALATLNAELHKNMSKLAQAEAAAASKTVRFEIQRENNNNNNKKKKKDGDEGIKGGEEKNKKKKRDIDEYVRRTRDSQTLAQIISLGENDNLFGFGGKKGRNKSMKQKPIIPLVGDLLFFKRKANSSTNHHNPLYASPF